MTEAEKNEIVGLVMTEISSQAVDFDIATEQPQANDLLTAVREVAGRYVGVTLKWDDVARIATEVANQAATRAEQAKTDANNILEQVQSKGTEITNFVATSKTEIETQKNESVNAVKSVYQTDFDELKGDLYGGSRTFALSNEELTVGYVTPGGSSNSNSSYRYGFIKISEATSATIHATGISNESMIVNVCDANKAFKRNLYNWVSAGDYSISSFQTGDEYLCISCLAMDVDKIYVSAEIPKGIIDNIEDKISAVEANVETKMPLAKVYGGVINRTLTDIVTGKYVNNVGTEVTSSGWCYGFVDISDAEHLTVDLSSISDATIINFVDKDKVHISNIGTWLTSDVTLHAIPYNAKYLCISCKQVDEPLISVDIAPYAEINAVDANTNDSFRYDSASAYIRTNTPNFLKGFHLDCGRKYFSVANIKLMIDAMYEANLNTLELYFSDDNGFRFGLNDMDIVVDGVTYDLSTALGDGASPTDGSDKWLTESDMDGIIEYANTKGIEVIPAFDMPSHMGAIRIQFPVNSPNLRANYGLGGEHGVKFMLAIIKKYATYFASKGSRYYNICCDETNTLPIDEIDMFMKRACKTITECHLTPMVFNDNVCINGCFDPYINTGALVLGWIKRNHQASYDMIENCGYRMVNCASNNHLYWTLGVTTTDDALLNAIRNTDIFLMADEKIHRNIKGAMFCVWCDQADADGADDGNHVTSQVIPCIEAFGEAVAKYVPENLIPMGQNVQTIEDIESMKNGGGLVLKSANGTKYKLTITNNGTVEINAVL